MTPWVRLVPPGYLFGTPSKVTPGNPWRLRDPWDHFEPAPVGTKAHSKPSQAWRWKPARAQMWTSDHIWNAKTGPKEPSYLSPLLNQNLDFRLAWLGLPFGSLLFFVLQAPTKNLTKMMDFRIPKMPQTKSKNMFPENVPHPFPWTQDS